MSICLVDCITSAKDPGVGSPSCNVPGCEAELVFPSMVLFVAAALFPPPLPAQNQQRIIGVLNMYSTEEYYSIKGG